MFIGESILIETSAGRAKGVDEEEEQEERECGEEDTIVNS